MTDTRIKRYIDEFDSIPEGRRDKTLYKMGLLLRKHFGLTGDALLYWLTYANLTKCTTPLPEADVKRIVRNVDKSDVPLGEDDNDTDSPLKRDNAETPSRQSIVIVAKTPIPVSGILEQGVSIYKGCIGNRPTNILKVGQILKAMLTGGQSREAILAIRNEPDKQKRGKMKQKLNAIAFGSKPQKVRTNEASEHNGILCVDIDDIPVDALESAKTIIAALPYVFAVVLSVSANGLFVLIAYEGTPDLKELIAVIQTDIPDYMIDTSRSDLCGLRYMTLDPDLILKNEVYPVVLTERTGSVDSTGDIILTERSANSSVKSSKPSKMKPRLKIILATDIEDNEIEWLLHNRIALGDISIIGGKGGIGKTFITTWLARLVTNGRSFNGHAVPQGCCLFMAGEGRESTFRKRLVANGAVLDLVGVAQGKEIWNEESQEYVLDPVVFKDIDAIERSIDDIEAQTGEPLRFMCFDPIGNFVPAGAKTATDAEVRKFLSPLSKLAERRNIAIILVAHTRKAAVASAQDAFLDSVAYVNAARSCWALFRDKNDSDLRICAPAKCNDAIDPKAFSFHITDGRVQIVDANLDQHADDLQAEQSNPQGRPATKRPKAEDWLRQYLADGEKPSTEIFEAAAVVNFAKRTIERAKDALGIKPRQVWDADEKTNQWFWELPADPSPPISGDLPLILPDRQN